MYLVWAATLNCKHLGPKAMQPHAGRSFWSQGFKALRFRNPKAQNNQNSEARTVEPYRAYNQHSRKQCLVQTPPAQIHQGFELGLGISGVRVRTFRVSTLLHRNLNISIDLSSV